LILPNIGCVGVNSEVLFDDRNEKKPPSTFSCDPKISYQIILKKNEVCCQTFQLNSSNLCGGTKTSKSVGLRTYREEVDGDDDDNDGDDEDDESDADDRSPAIISSGDVFGLKKVSRCFR